MKKNRTEYEKNLTRNDINGNISREGHPYRVLAWKRFSNGKTIEETLIPPMGHGGRRYFYEYDKSKVHPSINQKTISWRIQRNRSIEDAITIPLGCRIKRIKTEIL